MYHIRAINGESVHTGPKKTGTIILGGGLPKHHICNANMMHNAADFAVFINTAQEFDGSDSGARPDKAVSWGKMRGYANTIKFGTQYMKASFNQHLKWFKSSRKVISCFPSRLVSVGNLDVAVSLLLSTPLESSYFYANALRAVALSSAVVAANMVRTESSLSGTHLLCAVGRYQEACSQLQQACPDDYTSCASKLDATTLTRLVSVGNLDVAVSLLLSTPPESSYFYANALRAVALSSAVSKSLLKPAVKVKC
ncbi:unnamed protein product [Ilex paraguariensis]|uniref:WDR11 TPR domain-containing protein n=1 Tax=Ilex paraguariensis TaxID=185542 RepID=A0ABC8RK44_9AQUA